MKKSKKIPKTHLPKYTRGGESTTRAGGDSSRTMYGTEAGSYGSTMTTGQGGDATSNVYNEKRDSGLSNSQYTQMGQAVLTGGSQAISGYNDPNANSLEKTRAAQAGADTVKVGVASALNPALGAAVGTVTQIGSSVQTQVDRTDANGNIINSGDSKAGEIIGGFSSPSNSLIGIFSDPNATDSQKVAGALTGGISDMFTNRHKNQVESSAKADIEAQKVQQAEYDKQQAAYAQQQNNYNLMYNDYQRRNGSQGGGMYANGGINMKPNAEVEKQENTLNPDGTTTQFNGSSHEQGGIKTNLDPGTLIFSDKLKQNGKTFADLNKPNMTHKEDKILSDSKASTMSKITANLMKEAKNKSSIKLFESQESLKQSRVDNYIKRLGGVQKYPNGGITPEQYKQAQSDSLTLYNAGLKSNKIPYYEQPNVIPAMQRLQDINSTPGKIVAPSPIKGQAYGNELGYNGGYNVEFKKPTMIPYKEASLDNPAKVSVINHPNYTSYVPGIEKSKQPVMVKQFPNGGQLPKFEEGDMFGYKPTSKVEQMKMQQALLNSQNKPTSSSSWITPEMMQASSDQLIEEGYTPSNKLSKSTNTPTTSLGSKTDQELYDAELASMTSNESGNKTDWKNIGTQAAYFGANNAGNLYDLFRTGKVENRKYDRLTANLLDPTMDLHDAQMQNNRAEYNVRGASGGNAGTYLSNRVALNAQNTMNKSRIHQAYENANAGIKNETSKINTGIANEEILANAKIRANQRNMKQSAIASIGSNTANQMNDVRNTNMDQKRIDNLVKMYPSLSKDPEMLKYLMSFK